MNHLYGHQVMRPECHVEIITTWVEPTLFQKALEHLIPALGFGLMAAVMVVCAIMQPEAFGSSFGIVFAVALVSGLSR